MLGRFSGESHADTGCLRPPAGVAFVVSALDHQEVPEALQASTVARVRVKLDLEVYRRAIAACSDAKPTAAANFINVYPHLYAIDDLGSTMDRNERR